MNKQEAEVDFPIVGDEDLRFLRGAVHKYWTLGPFWIGRLLRTIEQMQAEGAKLPQKRKKIKSRSALQPKEEGKP